MSQLKSLQRSFTNLIWHDKFNCIANSAHTSLKSHRGLGAPDIISRSTQHTLNRWLGIEIGSLLTHLLWFGLTIEVFDWNMSYITQWYRIVCPLGVGCLGGEMLSVFKRCHLVKPETCKLLSFEELHSKEHICRQIFLFILCLESKHFLLITHRNFE